MRCLIVDDSPDFLDAARELLELEGVTVAGVAATGDDAVRLAGELRPDVVLVDIDLGAESGLTVAKRLADLRGEHGGNVILISTHDEDEFAELIDASSTIGFIPKSALSASAINRLVGPTGSRRADRDWTPGLRWVQGDRDARGDRED